VRGGHKYQPENWLRIKKNVKRNKTQRFKYANQTHKGTQLQRKIIFLSLVSFRFASPDQGERIFFLAPLLDLLRLFDTGFKISLSLPTTEFLLLFFKKKNLFAHDALCSLKIILKIPH